MMDRWIVAGIDTSEDADFETLTLRMEGSWHRICKLTAPLGTHRCGEVVVFQLHVVEA